MDNKVVITDNINLRDVDEIKVVEGNISTFQGKVNDYLSRGFFLIGIPTIYYNNGNTKLIQVLGR